MLNPKGLKFHQFKVGDIEVTQVFEGAVERPLDPAFARNASVEDIKSALRAAGLPDDKVPNSYTVTVIKLGDRQYMFDSGNGQASGNPNIGLLGENLKAAGIDAAKLSGIIITHFHPDHIFGLMTKDNAQVYPDTEIVVPAAEYGYWADPGVIAKLPEARQGIAKRVQATMVNWKNLRQHSGETEVVPGIRAVATPGHTAGHTSYHVSAGNGQFMVLGDISNNPAFNVRNPGWHLAVDQDAQTAEASRRRMFERLAAENIMASGYHWGMPGAGMVRREGDGYAVVPVTA